MASAGESGIGLPGCSSCSVNVACTQSPVIVKVSGDSQFLGIQCSRHF